MKTPLRRTLQIAAGLAATFVLFHLVEGVRGRLAVKAWRAAREAVGDRGDTAVLLPAPVSDADNFAAAPRVRAAILGRAPLAEGLPQGWPEERAGATLGIRPLDLQAFEGLQGVLASHREALDDLVVAARRPACRVNLAYDRYPDFEVPPFLGFRAAGRLLRLRAALAAREGRGADALRDVDALLRVSRHFQDEPILLCQLLATAYAQLGLQALWEGLEAGAWKGADLAVLEARLAELNLVSSYARSWKWEQAGMMALRQRVADEHLWTWSAYPDLEVLATRPGRLASFGRHLLIPGGWIRLHAVRAAEALQAIMVDPLDPAGATVDPRRQEAAERRDWNRGIPGRFLKVEPSLYGGQNVRMARIQAFVALARAACALERRRLEGGGLPARLEDLGAGIPRDPVGGGSLHYRRAGGGFILHSVGWDGRDDGGRASASPQDRQGDWVWAQRAPRP